MIDLEKVSIFISGNTPSSKNRQVITPNGNLVAGQSVVRWKRKTENEWITKRQIFLDHLKGLSRPYNIEFTFHRLRDITFDYINAAQAVQDAMVKYGWIYDDGCYDIKPFFGDYKHNKQKPGVYIRILKQPIPELL